MDLEVGTGIMLGHIWGLWGVVLDHRGWGWGGWVPSAWNDSGMGFENAMFLVLNCDENESIGWRWRLRRSWDRPSQTKSSWPSGPFHWRCFTGRIWTLRHWGTLPTMNERECSKINEIHITIFELGISIFVLWLSA
jgi:hypothetical protein